jgi:ribosomal protein S18 acetylase RimI-like enzyme
VIELRAVEGDRASWLPLLLEADEFEAIVRGYLDDGTLLAIHEAGSDVGVVLLIGEGGGEEIEIKNLAVAPEHQRRDVGRDAIGLIVERSRAAGARSLIVGTANSGLGTLRFYQRSGFRIDSVRAGFFDAYPTPIWEEGVRARDMVMLRMEL